MCREASSVEKSELQKSLSIHPKDTSTVLTGLFDMAISLHPRASILSASLFEPGGLSLGDHEPVIEHAATPGTTLDKAAPQMLQYCQAHDGDTFLPLFPPGRLLHITNKKMNTSKATWSVGVHVYCELLLQECNKLYVCIMYTGVAVV